MKPPFPASSVGSIASAKGSNKTAYDSVRQGPTTLSRKILPIADTKHSSSADDALPSSSLAKPYLSRSQDNLAVAASKTSHRQRNNDHVSSRAESSLSLTKHATPRSDDCSALGNKNLKSVIGSLRSGTGTAAGICKSASSNCIESSCSGPNLVITSVTSCTSKESQPKPTAVSRRFAANEKNTADVRINKTKLTVTELQKQKHVLELHVSDLVKNAETKQAEIATLHFELNRVREDGEQALERLRTENDSLKQRLRELGLCDSQNINKEITSHQKSEVGSALLLETQFGDQQFVDAATSPIRRGNTAVVRSTSEEALCSDIQYTCELSATDGASSSPNGMLTISAAVQRTIGDWDRQSISSMSEVSVACLQDRIVQMEETHYSTNEELQATLQELTDLQDIVNELSTQNEQLSQEKAVLLGSLCTQTEKLENSRLQIENLKHLLLSGSDFLSNRFLANSSDRSEREQQLVDMLKTTHEEHEELMCNYLELRHALRTTQEENQERQEMISILRDRARLLESQIDAVSEERIKLESELTEQKRSSERDKRELLRVQSHLEKERNRLEELQRCSQASDRSDIENLLHKIRHEKDLLHNNVIQLEESLSQKTNEVVNLRSRISSLEEELLSSRSSAGKTVDACETRIQQLEKENDLVKKQMLELRTTLLEQEERCKRCVEDKKEYKANILQLQKAVDELTVQRDCLRKEIVDLQALRDAENAEWKQFQADLQVAVVVANDFKMEASTEMEHLRDENGQLKDRLAAVQNELDKVKNSRPRVQLQTPPKSSYRSPLPTFGASPDLKTRVEGYMTSVDRSLGCLAANSRQSGHSSSTNSMSVRALIESLENGGGATQRSTPISTSSFSVGAASLMRSPGSAQRSQSGCGTTPENLVASKSATHLSTMPTIRRRDEVNDVLLKTPLSGTSSNGVDIDSPLCSSVKSSPQRTIVTTSSIDGSITNRAEDIPVDPLNASSRPRGILVNKTPTPGVRKTTLDRDEDPLAKLMINAPRGSRRNALLKWCQMKTADYKSVEITNFSSSWNDGLAFAALLHSYLPNLVPFSCLNANDKRRTFAVTFDAAESVGIPRLLNVDEMVSLERPDWQSIMNYVTAIYKHFET